MKVHSVSGFRKRPLGGARGFVYRGVAPRADVAASARSRWDAEAEAWKRLARVVQFATAGGAWRDGEAQALRAELRDGLRGAELAPAPAHGESGRLWCDHLFTAAKAFAAAPSNVQQITAPALAECAGAVLALIEAERAEACRRQIQRLTGERDDD